MYLHGADGAELLTAEATNAARAVDLRPSVLHLDRLGRADLGTFSAADAAAANGRARAERPPCDKGEGATEGTSLARKGEAAADRNVLKSAWLWQGVL